MPRNITPRDEAAARRLARIWNEKKHELGLTQVKLAEIWGVYQSTISQYLNGQIALNTDAILKFAKALAVSPLQIAPELLEDLLEAGNPMAWISVDEIRPEDGDTFFGIDAHHDYCTVRWTSSKGFVDTRTRKKVPDLIAVIPTLPPPS